MTFFRVFYIQNKMTTIMSWNVHLYYDELVNKRQDTVLCDNIIKCIKDQNPDILCLQEVSKYLISKLVEYNVASETVTHGGICATLIKGINSRKTHEYFQCGTNIVTDNELNISNLHLTPGDANQKFRSSQIQIIRDSLPQSSLQIIIGDMNMTNLESIPGMVDIGLSSSGENDDTWYCSFFDSRSKIRKRYDRAYTNVKTTSFKVIKEYQGYSDHIPIILTI